MASIKASRPIPTVRIDQSLRPIRFGFIVEPTTAGVQRAIEAATLSWGGRFCPMIPRLRRRRRWDSTSLAPNAIMRGIIEAFEPDLLVTDDAAEAERLGYPKERAVPWAEFHKETLSERPGLAMYFVYEGLYEEEFQYQLRHPRALVDPAPARGTPSLLHAAMFGVIPEGESTHRRALRDLGAVVDNTTIDTMLETLTAKVSPLRLTGDFLKWRVDPANILFFLDPRKPLDIIDYWNLRALGRRVIPVPPAWIDTLGPRLRQLIERENRPNARLQPWVTRGTFIKSRSISHDAFEAAGRAIDAPKEHVVWQHWVPRLFPAWAREADHAELWEPRAADLTTSVPADSQIDLDEPRLPWLKKRFYSRPALAVTLSTSMYFESHQLAQAVPPGTPGIAKLFDIRIWPAMFFSTSRGLVRMTGDMDRSLSLKLPSADDVFTSWFGARGLAATPSGAGRLARQMQRILPSSYDAHLVLNPHILTAFAKGARSSTRALSEEALAAALGRTHGGHKERADKHRERLLRSDVIRPGMLARCPHCGQENWFAFDALAAIVECDRCVNDFELPVSRPPKSNGWGFRLRGPFAVEGAGQGAYGVLATRAALARTRLLDAVTWSAGFDLAAPDGSKYEIDFAACGHDDHAGPRNAPIVAIGEAKTGGAFGLAGAGGRQSMFRLTDVSKARALARVLPEAAFIFATLAPALSETERNLLSAFVRSQRRECRGTVMVLTAHELLSDDSFLNDWRGSVEDSERGRLGAALGYIPSFRAAAEATTKLYLDIAPSADWPAFQLDASSVNARRRSQERRDAGGSLDRS
jgi:hypothetical protein